MSVRTSHATRTYTDFTISHLAMYNNFNYDNFEIIIMMIHWKSVGYKNYVFAN
jgi:hypothetical protein